MHHACGGVAQQRLHEHAAAVVVKSPAGVGHRGGAPVGRTSLPIACALSEVPCPVDDQYARQGVERELDPARHIAEHLTMRIVSVFVESEGSRRNARSSGDGCECDADAQHKLVRPQGWLAHGGEVS